MSERQQIEDALKHIYDRTAAAQTATVADLAGATAMAPDHVRALVQSMATAGLVTQDGEGLALTPSGRDYALQVVRAHRLYETYLAQRTGFTAQAWHRRAHAAEHGLSRAEVDRLAASLGNPSYDPHGDPIPTAAGTVPPQHGTLLSAHAAGWAGRIVHVEDEPAEVYRRLARGGFAPDVRLRLEKSAADSLTVRLDGQVVDLSPAEAAQVTVDELPPGESFDDSIVRLSDVRMGERGEVVGISPLIHGLARGRLLDLGVVPGTTLEIDLVGPAGDPVAYLVRGASIALRREQSDRILVRLKRGEAS